MQTLGGNKGPAIKTLFMCRGEPTMPRSFTIIATALLSFAIVSCSTSDNAAGQPSPIRCPSPPPQPVSELSTLPSHPPSNLFRLIPPHLKRHPNLHLPIAESRHLAELSPMQLTALHHRAPHTLLGPMKEKATTIPARNSVTRCWFSSHKAILNLAPNCCSSTKVNTSGSIPPTHNK